MFNRHFGRYLNAGKVPVLSGLLCALPILSCMTTHAQVEQDAVLPNVLKVSINRFIQKAKLASSGGKVSGVTRKQVFGAEPVYACQISPGYSLFVANDGTVVRFSNDFHFKRQLRGEIVESYVFLSEAEAKARLQSFAKDLGIPRAWKLFQFNYYRDGDPRIADANPSGSVSAGFMEKPYGYPFFSGGNSASIAIDPHDGTLTNFLLVRSARVVSHTVKLSEVQAITRAKVFGAKIVLKGLGYVLPISEMKTGESLGDLNKRLRLAYVFKLRRPSVSRAIPIWIDAGDGRLLSPRPRVERTDPRR